jgi:hypothetical protein
MKFLIRYGDEKDSEVLVRNSSQYSLKKIRKKLRICNPDNSVPLRLRFHLRWAENNDWYYSG